MNVWSTISREIFAQIDEKLLTVIKVKKRKKRLSFISSGYNYITYLCLSVSNKKPLQGFITKVKQYDASGAFERRSRWSLDQLRRVDGINHHQDSPEFDLVFDEGSDQWVAQTSEEKCMFVLMLHRLCQKLWDSMAAAAPAAKSITASTSTTANPSARGTSTTQQPASQTSGTSEKKKKKKSEAPSRTEFINCQSKLIRDSFFYMLMYRWKIFLNHMRNSLIPAQQQLHPKNQTAVNVKAAGSISSPPALRIVGGVGRRASKVLTEHSETKPPALLSASL